jgi:Na+(H+)/acetate symporter ActP
MYLIRQNLRKQVLVILMYLIRQIMGYYCILVLSMGTLDEHGNVSLGNIVVSVYSVSLLQ